MVLRVRWIFLSTSLIIPLAFGDMFHKSISHGKPCKMHFLAYFTLQSTLVMLHMLRKVEDHENHVRWIYLTTVLYMGEVRSMRKQNKYLYGFPDQMIWFFHHHPHRYQKASIFRFMPKVSKL